MSDTRYTYIIKPEGHWHLYWRGYDWELRVVRGGRQEFIDRERLDYWNRARSVTVDDRDLTFLTSILATLDEERHS